MDKSKSDDEGELISRLHNSDLRAFDDLYWKYQRAVFQNALKLTRDEADAEDIVQEVFVSLWERRLNIDVARGVGGWLFVSSYNRSVNMLKRKLKESVAMKELEKMGITDQEGNFDTEVQLTILENAIAGLSPQKRRVFELCKLEGHTYEEAARALNISKHTVKEYLSDALVAVKEYAANHSGAACGLLAFLVYSYW